jgi:flagellar biosynthetic protein FliP
MALGMIMVPPSTVSLPLKLLLFVLIDGWVLLSRALLSSYWS